MTELVPGAPVVYPARVVGTDIAHLARTEARADAPPALLAICPAGRRMSAELELIPEDDADRIVWCGACRAYKDHIENVARIGGAVREAASS